MPLIWLDLRKGFLNSDMLGAWEHSPTRNQRHLVLRGGVTIWLCASCDAEAEAGVTPFRKKKNLEHKRQCMF